MYDIFSRRAHASDIPLDRGKRVVWSLDRLGDHDKEPLGKLPMKACGASVLTVTSVSAPASTAMTAGDTFLDTTRLPAPNAGGADNAAVPTSCRFGRRRERQLAATGKNRFRKIRLVSRLPIDGQAADVLQPMGSGRAGCGDPNEFVCGKNYFDAVEQRGVHRQRRSSRNAGIQAHRRPHIPRRHRTRSTKRLRLRPSPPWPAAAISARTAARQRYGDPIPLERPGPERWTCWSRWTWR